MARSLVTTAIELCEISYRSDAHAVSDAKELGFLRVKHYGNGGPHAMVAEDEHSRYVVYRGTEVTDFEDILADLRIIPERSRIGGYVHRGFQDSADNLWMDMSDEFHDNKPLVFCGHSLGGALAMISATQTGRYRISRNLSLPIIVTAGCPMVGSYLWRRAAVSFAQKIVRVSNNNDPVCRVALWPLYGHPRCESLHFTNSGDLLQNPGFRERLTDTSVGCCDFVVRLMKAYARTRSYLLAFTETLGEFDHAIDRYARMARKHKESIDEKIHWPV